MEPYFTFFFVLEQAEIRKFAYLVEERLNGVINRDN